MSLDVIAPQPVYDDYFADPFVWKHGGLYYAVGTGPAEAAGTADAPRAVPLLRSSDLRRWKFVHHALVHPGAALGGEIWAPAVAFGEDGRFYLYYSIGQCSAGQPHHLRVAVSDGPEGPYVDTGAPLLLPGDEVFVFDPDPFRDDDGQWYLFYDRNDLDVTDAGRAGDAISARRLPTMTTVSGEAVSIVRPDSDWQRGPQREHRGQTIDWHTAEGPCIAKRGSVYYCFYSGSAWFTDGYGVDYAVSDHVLGPYQSEAAGDAPRVLKSGVGGLRGPGHNSLVTGPDGADWIVFHAWDAARQKRQMYVEKLYWTAQGPRGV